jgi:hypothetical protein
LILDIWETRCCNVAVTQINYLCLNKQDSIKQARGRSHKEGLVQIFMLNDMQLGGGAEVI